MTEHVHSWESPETMRAVCDATGLTPADLPKFQTCYFAEKSGPPRAHVPTSAPPKEVVVDPNAHLRSFQLIPPDLKYRDIADAGKRRLAQLRLFEHLVRHRNRRAVPLTPRYAQFLFLQNENPPKHVSNPAHIYMCLHNG
jgi:hypothetical protein